jgi:hypothetical protein
MTYLLVRPERTIACAALSFIFFSISAAAMGSQQTSAATPASGPDIVLEGVVTGAQNQTYIQVPFVVPAGTERVTLTFAYTGKEQHTALDLGLLDPAVLRCWSGGNKSLLTVGINDATPSCLPGLIPPGTWNVLIGVPNIRPNVESHFTVHLYFSSTGSTSSEPAVLNVPLRAGPAWYRGDLHMHTAQSDGECPSQTGKMVPCPVYFTADAAARRGLDFIAITDHNATSQYNPMRELQPYFDKLLLISGREITTFDGHINLLGTTDFVDFRLGSKEVPDMNTLLRSAGSMGGITSINHPGDPSGELCMGCGWTPQSKVDMQLLTAVEAVNGGSEQYGIPNIPFWDKQLNVGCRLAGIGGSDNHRPMQPLDGIGSIGSPTTVVYATELSTPAIVAGIRAGHVFIDIAGTRDRLFEVTARVGDKVAHMGDFLVARDGETVNFNLHVTAAAGGNVRWIEDGHEVALKTASAVSSADQSFPMVWVSDGRRHWFRAEVAGADGKQWLLGNPVYANWEIANQCGDN